MKFCKIDLAIFGGGLLRLSVHVYISKMYYRDFYAKDLEWLVMTTGQLWLKKTFY